MYTAPTGGKTNISRWKGPGCRESAGYAALHPVIASPSYPAPTPAARQYQHAAPLEVDCALRPAAGRGSARPSRRLGRSAGHAYLALSVALKWCRSTGRWLSNLGSGRTKVNISNILSTLENCSFYNTNNENTQGSS